MASVVVSWKVFGSTFKNHTPTMVQRGGGRYVTIFRKDFKLSKKACDVLCETGYTLWVEALVGACDVIQDGGQFGRHLGFYRK